MPSEYDFLLPYSRRLRRLGAIGMGVGAFLAGAVCMAAIIALPLRPHGGGESGGTVAAAQDEQKPAAHAVAAAKPEEKPAAQRPDASPQVAASPASDQRETTGLVSPTAKPADAPASTPAPPVTTAAKAADTPAAPASAQTSTSSGKPAKQKTALPAREPAAAMAAAPSTAEGAAATPNSAEPAAPDNKPKATERRKSRSTHASRRQQQRRYARSSDDAPSSSRSAFADDDRTRYGGTSTFWRERDSSTRWRDYSDPASAYDQRPSRRVIIIRRPSWFGDDD